MPTTTEEFKNDVHFPNGLTLFVGRKKTVIAAPSRFECKRELPVLIDNEMAEPVYISNVPIRESYSLWIDGKLFSITHPTGTKRFSVKLIKPLNAGLPEIHLVKKHTAIRESVRKTLQWK